MKTHQTSTTMLLVAALLFSAGCAFVPQKVNLAPAVTVTDSAEGKGTAVALRVTDDRPAQSLGRRGTASGAVAGTANRAAAEITTTQDIAAIVRDEIAAGLKTKSFIVGEGGGLAGNKLSVEVRLLEYSTSQGFWTGGVNVKVALKATASKPGRSYEKMYRTDKEVRVSGVPTAGQNEQWINEALSDGLRQLLDDNGLTKFLANDSGPTLN